MDVVIVKVGEFSARLLIETSLGRVSVVTSIISAFESFNGTFGCIIPQCRSVRFDAARMKRSELIGALPDPPMASLPITIRLHR